MTCLYQFFRKPKYPIMEGWGDCEMCVESADNQNCRGYIKINLTEFLVEDYYGEEDAEQKSDTQGTQTGAQAQTAGNQAKRRR